jgi:two-component sensor histidine kinase
MRLFRGRQTAVVEPPPGGNEPDFTLSALRQRIRQQEILAELGVRALQGASFDALLADTVRLTAEGLHAEFCKILEHIPTENRFLVREGIGWGPDVVGVASVGADLASPAGYALQTGKPVISNHLENEERFRTPDVLKKHNIHRAMNVILQGDGRPFGVLEVDSRSEDEFKEHDIAFLQGAANILGMAIERERHERNMSAALERHGVLLREMSHRVKNSLAIIASMLHLQSLEAADPVITAHLNEASHRVAAVARAHDQLYMGSETERLDVGKYIEGICKDLDKTVSGCDLVVNVDHGIEVKTDDAISVALIVNELIANAAKYAYSGKTGCKIWVTIACTKDSDLLISVRDEGSGIPADYDPHKAKGLGMRLVNSFAKQLKATVEILPRNPGTEFVIRVPHVECPTSVGTLQRIAPAV